MGAGLPYELGGKGMPVSQSIEALTRRNHTTILRAMALVSQKRVAELVGVSDTTISRLKDDDLERLAAILAACNLVAQPNSFKSVDPDRLRALTILAREALDRETSEFGASRDSID